MTRTGRTIVLVPICVREPTGFYGGPSGYYRRKLGDTRNGPLIVEPGTTTCDRPLLLTDDRLPRPG